MPWRQVPSRKGHKEAYETLRFPPRLKPGAAERHNLWKRLCGTSIQLRSPSLSARTLTVATSYRTYFSAAGLSLCHAVNARWKRRFVGTISDR
jgi:hypothetical protein